MVRHDVRTELFHSGGWDPITGDVYTRDDVVIGRGQPDEGQQLRPQTAGLTLDNRSGRYSPRNPRSPLFGRIGRSTPLRMSVGEPHVGAVNFDLADTTDHVAPSVDSPTDEALLLCCWAAPQNDVWTLPPGMTAGSGQQNDQSLQTAFQAISAAGPTGTRTATFGVAEDYMAASILLHGASLAVEESEGDSNKLLVLNARSQPGEWAILFSSWWGSGALATVPDYPVAERQDGWILLADTGIIAVGDPQAGAMRLKVWVMQVKTPGPQNITLGGDDTARSVLHVVSGAADWSYRFHNEIANWPPKSDRSGNDARTPIQSAGITRRHGRTQTTLRDVIHRFMTRDTSGDLVAYWPLDDPRGSHAGRAVLGMDLRPDPAPGQFIEFRDLPEFGQGSLYEWLPPAAKLTTESGRMKAAVSGTVAGEFVLSWLYRADRSTADSNPVSTDFVVDCGEFSFEIHIAGIVEDITVRAFGPSGLLGSDNTGIRNTTDGETHHFQFHMFEFAASTSVRLSVDLDGEEIFAGNVDLGVDVPPPVDGITLRWIATTPDATVTTNVGQLSLWNDQPADLSEFVTIHTTGHSGERPSVRFDRILNEEGIPHAIVGETVSEEVLLGAQYPGRLIDSLREIAATGQGWLYESRNFRGYVYRQIGSAYNQPSALQLDYATGQVAPVFEPIEDDQRTVNDVTVQNRGGGEVRRVRRAGPLNVNDPADDPDGAGRLDTSVTVNVAADGNLLANQAGWRLHLGTVDGPRHPQISVDLDAQPELAAAAGRLDVGDRITIRNPPDWLPPEQISQIVLGYAETLRPDRRRITFNCAPESAYHIAEIEHADYDIIGSDGSTTAVSFDAGTETILEVAVAEGFPPWVHETDFDVLVFGVRLTVTTVGALSPSRVQQFTVNQAPVNGIAKPIPAGERVDVFHASHIGL